jgi:threonine dehydrogenase-like Zn-dependent dehydrogenase
MAKPDIVRHINQARALITVAAPAGPKLDLIERLAADAVVAIDRKDPEVHRHRLDQLSPNGFDYVVEATGAALMAEDAMRFVRRRGTILVYGVTRNIPVYY